MGVKYAGVSLNVYTSEMAERIAAQIPLADLVDFQDLPGLGRQRISSTKPWLAMERSVRVGSLWWPTGASRFAIAHFVVSDSRLQEISQVVYAAGSYAPADLVISQTKRIIGPLNTPIDQVVSSVTASMWMLPPRPLFQIEGANGLWLLTLVDDRYWWWFRDTDDVPITVGTTTWADLYSAVGTALGVTITADSVPSAYLTPTSAFEAHYEKTPVYLDQIAFTVGQRVVRKLDGTVVVRNPVNSVSDEAANLLLNVKPLGGGEFRFTPGEVNDLPGILPGTVTVVFQSTDSSSPYHVDTTLASLNLTDFNSVVTNSNTATFDNTNGFTGSNGATLTTLAQQFATDWYRWQVGNRDIQFDGIVEWQPTAFDNFVEWHHNSDNVTTRVVRGPMNDPMSTSTTTPANITTSTRYGDVNQTFPITLNFFGSPSYNTYITYNQYTLIWIQAALNINACLYLGGYQRTAPSNAPTVTVGSGGTGRWQPGSYYAKITYVDWTNAETTASPETSVITVTGINTLASTLPKLTIALNNTPPSTISYWRIYITPVNGGSGSETCQQLPNPTGQTPFDVPIGTTSIDLPGPYYYYGNTPPASRANSQPYACFVPPVCCGKPAWTGHGGEVAIDLCATPPTWWVQYTAPSGTDWLNIIGTTAKGDLISHNGTDATIVPITGSDGYVLTKDAASTCGMKWAAGGGAVVGTTGVFAQWIPFTVNYTDVNAGTVFNLRTMAANEIIQAVAAYVSINWTTTTTEANGYVQFGYTNGSAVPSSNASQYGSVTITDGGGSPFFTNNFTFPFKNFDSESKTGGATWTFTAQAQAHSAGNYTAGQIKGWILIAALS